MHATSEKQVVKVALTGIAFFLLGIYWILFKEDFIILESWDDYAFLSLYFAGPIMGIIGSIRDINSDANWKFKLLWYVVLIISIGYLAVLVYGITQEIK